jgi:hypothetical protein
MYFHASNFLPVINVLYIIGCSDPPNSEVLSQILEEQDRASETVTRSHVRKNGMSLIPAPYTAAGVG